MSTEVNVLVGIIAVFGLILIVVGVLSIASSYSKVQASSQNTTLTNQDEITACQVHKNTLINASKFSEISSDPLYTKELNYYNSVCAIMTGALK